MTYRPAPAVAWLVDDARADPTLDRAEAEAAGAGTVVVVHLPDGEPLALAGSAAAIWLCALEAPDEAAVVERVSRGVGVPVETAAPDTRALLADLLQRGLLVDS